MFIRCSICEGNIEPDMAQCEICYRTGHIDCAHHVGVVVKGKYKRVCRRCHQTWEKAARIRVTVVDGEQLKA